MTNNTFSRDLDLWLREDAAHRVPDHLAELLVQSAAMRQRPWWSSLERWLPMDLTTRASTLAPPRLGRMIVIALLVLALAAAAIVVVGSRQNRVPPPFGPAANGIRIASSDGDIYALDAMTQVPRPLITDPAFDFGTTWSRDGTKFLFLRAATQPTGDDPVLLTLAVASADGTNVRELVGPVEGLDWFDWSPDGTRIAYLTAAVGGGALNVVNVATGETTPLGLGFPVHHPTWMPPNGNEILVRREGRSPALFAVRPDGTGIREVSARMTGNETDYGNPVFSPDGTQIMFTAWNKKDGLRLFVLDLASGTERTLPNAGGTIQGLGTFSPDGRSVAYARGHDNGTFELVVAPADGSSAGEAHGGVATFNPNVGMDVTVSFSPDGSALVARYGNDAFATYKWIPLDGSPMTALDAGSFEFVDVQRLAP